MAKKISKPRKIMNLLAAVSMLLLASSLAALASPRSRTEDDSVLQVQHAVNRLQQWYNPQTGLWKTAGWWNAANALTAIIDFSRLTHSMQYRTVLDRTYAANIGGGFLNQYYDDEGWWALAWIDAYDLTGDQRYLHTAGAIFNDMTGGWDNTCGGGLWWRKKRDYKNAIANELFLSVAAHLANRVSDDSQRARYAAWAKREWNWFQHSGLIEKDHLISDGLNSQCQDNHGIKWSYNQGVILGGLTELSHRRGSRGTLREAKQIANAAIGGLADRNGVLHDPCEPNCSGDGTQFKGIFIRNLALLNARSPSQHYVNFMDKNAESLLKFSQGPGHSFGVVWSGPPGSANAVSQSSAIDALVAALSIRNKANR